MGKDGKYFTSILNITSDFVLQVKASCNAETLDLLNDTYRFLFSHHQTISESAMHTYYSALPFTPHNTRLYCLYEQEASHSVTVLQGLSPTWTSCLSTLSPFGWGENIICTSPDGMSLAVGQHREIMILDARTTATQCQISLMDSVVCLAFSPSESVLAAVTYKSLELWNTTTGVNQKTQPFSGTYSYPMAFSSQGQYLLLSSHQQLHLHGGTDAGELSVLSTDQSHTCIIFTANDTQVITGSDKGYIHFFTLSGNRLSEIWERRIFNETRVCGLVLRHDGKRLASSGVDGTIRIYDLPSLSPIATLQQPKDLFGISAIAYHPMEEELAVADNHKGGCVVLWRQKEISSDWVPSIHSNHSYEITGIAYCQSGTQMYTGTRDGDLKLWATTVTRVQEPPKHATYISCHAINQPTSLLATGSGDGSIILWNFTMGDYQKTLLGCKECITSLAFSDDGVLLASADGDRMTIVWDVASGSLLHKLAPHGYSRVLEFGKDNGHLKTGTNGECFVWELKSGELLERRSRDISVGQAHTEPCHLRDVNGWQIVMSDSQQKKCKYALCRPPGEYGITSDGFTPSDSAIFGNRAALFCDGGRVLILDVSKVMNLYMDPAGWRDYDMYDNWPE